MGPHGYGAQSYGGYAQPGNPYMIPNLLGMNGRSRISRWAPVEGPGYSVPQTTNLHGLPDGVGLGNGWQYRGGFLMPPGGATRAPPYGPGQRLPQGPLTLGDYAAMDPDYPGNRAGGWGPGPFDDEDVTYPGYGRRPRHILDDIALIDRGVMPPGYGGDMYPGYGGNMPRGYGWGGGYGPGPFDDLEAEELGGRGRRNRRGYGHQEGFGEDRGMGRFPRSRMGSRMGSPVGHRRVPPELRRAQTEG